MRFSSQNGYLGINAVDIGIITVSYTASIGTPPTAKATFSVLYTSSFVTTTILRNIELTLN